MNLLLIAIGVLSSCTLIISALSVHRLRLLLFGIATGALVALQYAITGAWTGLLAVLIGLAWTVCMALAYRYPQLGRPGWIPVVLAAHVAAFVLLTDWAAQLSPIMFVPVLGGILGTLAVYTRELIHTKGILIVAGGAWLAYEYSHAVYGQMIGESLNLIANAVAISALIAARRRGIPRSAMQNIDTQLLGVITSSIQLPESYRGITNRFPAASLHGRLRPVRGAHPQSVGYARMSAEYERGFAQMRTELVHRFSAADAREREAATPAGRA